MATPTHYCYVDESGDEHFAFARGSPRWFVLSGVVVRREDESQTRCVVDAILERCWCRHGQMPPKQLHWRDLNHERKVVVTQELVVKPFQQVIVAIDKASVNEDPGWRGRDGLYRLAARMLVERVTWLVDEALGSVRFVFGNRKTFHAAEFRAYLDGLLHDPTTEVRPVFAPADVQVRDAADVKMLQVADSCASAVGCALNTDPYGNCHTLYAEALAGRFWRSGGDLLGFGLTLFPHRGAPEGYTFVQRLETAKLAPDPTIPPG